MHFLNGRRPFLFTMYTYTLVNYGRIVMTAVYRARIAARYHIEGLFVSGFGIVCWQDVALF